MRKFIAIAIVLVLSTCLLAGCRNRNSDTTMPSTNAGTMPSTAATTAPTTTPRPIVTTPGTTGEGVLPSIADDIMPNETTPSSTPDDMVPSRRVPRY